MPAGEQRRFAIPFGENQTMFLTKDQVETELEGIDTELVFKAEWSDPFGREYDTKEHIGVLESVGQGAGFEVTHRDNLEEIQGDVEKIRRETNKLRKETRKQRKAVEKMSRMSSQKSFLERGVEYIESRLKK